MADLYNIITGINRNGLKINREYLDTLTAELKNMAMKQLYLLMDKNFISSLDFEDVSELVKALSQEFGKDIDSLFSAVDGTIYISTESTEVARKITSNTEFKEILGILHDYCYAVELLDDIKELELIISKNNILNPKITMNSKEIKASCNILNRKEFYTLLEDRENFGMLNAKSLVYFEFLCSIGIEEDVLVKHKQINKGIFLKQFTFAEEVDICNYIMEFHIKPNTEHKSLYYSAMRQFYDPKTKRVDKEKYLSGYIEDVMTILDSIEDNEVIPRLITKYMFLVEFNASKISRKLSSLIGQPVRLTNERKRIWENSGLYVLNWKTGDELNKCNALRGNTGEFISDQSIKELSKTYPKDKYDTIISNAKKVKPYKMYGIVAVNRDIAVTEYTMYRVEDLGLQCRVGKDIIFTYTDINIVFKRYGVSSILELFKAVYKDIRNLEPVFNDYGDKEYYKLILADIIMVLITADCGIEYISNVSLDAKIDKIYENNYNLFYKACYEAEKYIADKKLI